MSALALPRVGYATNADHGAGCNVHPPAKQYCSKRLADSTLALHYGRKIPWRSPSFASSAASVTSTSISVAVSLKDVSTAGLTNDVTPYNSGTVYGGGLVNCTKLNAAQPDTCAWAIIQLESGERLNATVSVAPGGQKLVLAAPLPKSFSEFGARNDASIVIATSYAYGAIPMMTAYDKQTGLPVLPWNRTIVA